MTAELGFKGVPEEEKVPQNHDDAEDDVDDAEEDGAAPDAGAGGTYHGLLSVGCAEWLDDVCWYRG